RIRAECACLINGSRRRYQLHQIAAASVSAHGKAATDDFAVRYQIRPSIEKLGHAAQGDSKSGDYLVKNNEAAVLPSDPYHLFNEFATLNQQTVVCWLGFQNDGRDLRAISIENRTHALFIIKRSDQRFAGNSFRDAGA